MSKGVVREPNVKVVYRNKFKNLDIYKYIPVDAQGNLVSPNNTGYALYSPDSEYANDFVFGRRRTCRNSLET